MRGVPHMMFGAGFGLLLAGPGSDPQAAVVDTLNAIGALDVPSAIAAFGHSQRLLLPVYAAVLGSLLPDLDNDYSTLGKVPVLGGIGHLIAVTIARALSRLRPIHDPFPPGSVLVHRGPVHTPAFAYAMAIVLFLCGVNAVVTTALLVGMLSHLVGDSFTKTGIAWLWPFRCETVRLVLSWRSGNWLFEWPMALGVLVLSVRYVHGS